MSQSKPAFQFATLSANPVDLQNAVVLWQLDRRSAISPAQLGWLYLLLCLISLGMAGFLGLQNAMAVMTFALLAVGTIFVVYSRHAGDTEQIVLQGGQLVIELETAGRTRRAAFDRDRVRVEPGHEDSSLIQVSGQGQLVQVGRHVRPELRQLLAREIRFALRTY